MEAKSSNLIKILLCSDIMQHEIQHESGKKFGYDNIFSKDVISIMDSADVVVGNLETVISGNEPQGFPKFSAPIQFLEKISKHFDAVSLANNHILDHDVQGLSNTIKACDALNLKWFGAMGTNFLNVQTHDGIDLTFHGFTDISNEQVPHSGVLSTKFVEAEMEDSIGIVYIHTGVEYSAKPTRMQKMYARTAEHLGYSACVMIHSHVIGSMQELRQSRTFVTNGLGNMIGFQESLSAQTGRMIMLTIDVDTKLIVDVAHHDVETILVDNMQQVVLK